MTHTPSDWRVQTKICLYSFCFEKRTGHRRDIGKVSCGLSPLGDSRIGMWSEVTQRRPNSCHLFYLVAGVGMCQRNVKEVEALAGSTGRSNYHS